MICSIIIIKTTGLSEPGNRSIVRKDRGVQHASKGGHGLIQHSLGSPSSYCKYVYLSFEKWETVPSTQCWSATGSSDLKNTGRRFFKRAAEALSTNSGRNQCTKFTKDHKVILLGGSVSINLGLPNGSNSYGNRVSVLARNYWSEGEQLKTFNEETLATESGFDLFKDSAEGKRSLLKNVYGILCDPKILKAGYKKLKSNFAFLTRRVGEKKLKDLRINE